MFLIIDIFNVPISLSKLKNVKVLVAPSSLTQQDEICLRSDRDGFFRRNLKPIGDSGEQGLLLRSSRNPKGHHDRIVI